MTLEAFWLDVGAEVERRGGGSKTLRFVALCRKRESRKSQQRISGPSLAMLRPGTAAWRTAVTAIASKVTTLIRYADFKRARTASQATWHQHVDAVRDELNLDALDLALDINTLSIHRARRPPRPISSLAATLDRYAKLIALALHDPYAARRMAQDGAIPPWLRQLAETITAGDHNPLMRRKLEQCLRDPQAARRWHRAVADANVPAWFVECTRILGMRKASSSRWK